MNLKIEQECFERNKTDWLKAHRNEWVWVRDGQPKFFSSYEQAIEAAYAAGFDKEPIFVKQILETEETPFIAGYYLVAV